MTYILPWNCTGRPLKCRIFENTTLRTAAILQIVKLPYRHDTPFIIIKKYR